MGEAKILLFALLNLFIVHLFLNHLFKFIHHFCNKNSIQRRKKRKNIKHAR